MSKKCDLTVDIIETLVTRVTEKLLDKMADNFKLLLDQVMNVMGERIDRLERTCLELTDQLKSEKNQLGSANERIRSQKTEPANEAEVLKALLQLEEEQKDRAKRSKNIIVSGLKEVEGKHDADVFVEFCERHLEIKPRPNRAACKRVSKAANGQPGKLLITLDSEETAAQLIRSSAALRRSTNEDFFQVHINPDLTKLQARMAFEERQKKRELKKAVSDKGASIITT